MSQSQVFTGKTLSFTDPDIISPPTAPFQQSEIIDNKIDKDGHHYLKVLLLSNKKTRNKWIVPYQKIGDLPKQVIDSFVGLPYLNEHHYPYFQKRKEQLVNEGKGHEEIAEILKEECRQLGLDHIDHLFYDPESPTLYGQLKVMDKKENDYISAYNKTRIKFTSPGVFGDASELEDGTNVYDPNTLRAFHVAGVNIPAFPEQEAEVKGLCMNGNSESCRKVLAVAGFNSELYPTPTTAPSGTIPLENVNNNCSCNKNIDMSNNPQITTNTNTTATTPGYTVTTSATNPNNTTTTTFPTTATDGTIITPQVGLVEGAKNSTQEAIEAARAEAQKVVDENKKKTSAEEKENENKKPELTPAELELRQTNKELQKEREEKQEMKNFFLEKMLISAIPRENFTKEDEFIQLKESTKGLINKYGMTLEDADWFISKVSKSVPPLSTENDDKKKPKKDIGVGGWYGSMYNSDSITRPVTAVPKPASSGSSSGIDEDDYPIPV